MYKLNVNNRGYALVVSTTFMLLLSLTAYLVITHSGGVRDAGKYLKNSETTQTMLSLRNVLVEDAIAIGSLRNADPNDSLPSYLVGLNYNPPVNDVWGSEIKYCVYSDFNQPVRGLAGRLLSAGENRKLQTLCSDETAKGDDIAINIFADAIDGTIISPELTWSPPVMISANNASSYLVREDGTVWAWGYNVYSVLQDGTNINRRLPVQSLWSANANDFMTDVKEVSAGTTSGVLMLRKDSTVWAASLNKYPMQMMSDAVKVQSAGPGTGTALDEPIHGMALKSDGTAWAWGYNAPSRELIKARILYSATSVSVSKTAVNTISGHALGVGSDGTVWAWGRNNYGQLGDGTNADSITCPVQVSGLSDVIATSAGISYSLALKSDGTVWTWGYNSYGLGNGALQSLTPVQVKGPGGVGFLTEVIAISAGTNHSLALKSDGTVWAWGYNAYSRLGDGTVATKAMPVQVKGAGGVGFLTGVIAISAGAYHSMALKSDGTVWAWGYNAYSQLGDGTVTHTSNTTCKCPVQVMADATNGTPLTGIIAISAGGAHSMALKSDGTVWAWGYNAYGRLGDGTATSTSLTTCKCPVQVMADAASGTPLTGLTAISAGADHSMALKLDGTVLAWGRNNINNELGDETSTTSYIPVQVRRLAGVSMIAAGGGNSFAVGPDNAVWAWGKGWPSAFIPALISGPNGEGTLTGVTQIAVNYYTATINHSLAVRSDGTVWAWGANNYGQLGDGTTTASVYPVQVSGLSNVVAVAVGSSHSMALKSDGTVWAWGYNSYGRLGDGTTIRRLTPVQVSGLSEIVDISAGSHHSMALKSDGTVWSWGQNTSGQLGDGTTSWKSKPAQVSGLSNIKAIATGGGHSMAFRSDGTIWAWGLNSSGQLGNGSWINKTKPANVLYVRYVIP